MRRIQVVKQGYNIMKSQPTTAGLYRD